MKDRWEGDGCSVTAKEWVTRWMGERRQEKKASRAGKGGREREDQQVDDRRVGGRMSGMMERSWGRLGERGSMVSTWTCERMWRDENVGCEETRSGKVDDRARDTRHRLDG